MASTNSFIAAQIQILPPPMLTRRHCLLLLTAATALKAVELPCRAQDIPLFGLRKGLHKVEQIVKEGFQAADKGIAAADKGTEATERGVVAAEEEIETVLGFGGLAQAGVVAGADVCVEMQIPFFICFS